MRRSHLHQEHRHQRHHRSPDARHRHRSLDVDHRHQPDEDHPDVSQRHQPDEVRLDADLDGHHPGLERMGCFHPDVPLDVGYPCPGWRQTGCYLVEGYPLESMERLALPEQEQPQLELPVPLVQQGLEPEQLAQQPQVLPQVRPLP